MDKVAKKHWEKIQMDPDPAIHSLLNKPWELWLESEKISTEKMTTRTHLWPSGPGILGKQNKVLRDGHPGNRLGDHTKSCKWHDNKTKMMDNQIHNWLLCDRKNAVLVGPERNCCMSMVQT